MAVWADRPADPASTDRHGAASCAPVSADEERLRSALREDPDIAELLAVLDETIAALDNADVEYMLMGGIASSCMGRERWTHDIDLFMRPAEALRALEVLREAGFDTEETFPDWLFKAHKDGQLVDIIFRSGGGVLVDSEMVDRAPRSTFMGRDISVVPAEDMIVIKALVASEHSPRHWHDALAIIASADLDWQYLMRRARLGVRRVMSLLLYAQSEDLPVPAWVVADMFAMLEGI
jgi:predicted nucleotidyltransferase